MVDLKAKPYYLSDEDIKWVEDTIAGMTDEEKVGQLFVNMVNDFTPEGIKKVVDTYHPARFVITTNPRKSCGIWSILSRATAKFRCWWLPTVRQAETAA